MDAVGDERPGTPPVRHLAPPHLDGQHVRAAEELEDERRRRILVDGVHRAGLEPRARGPSPRCGRPPPWPPPGRGSRTPSSRAARRADAAASGAARGARGRPARRTARRGSSTRGSTASARASATRWRWPPESCEGMRSSRPSSWTSWSSLWDALRDLVLRRARGAAGEPKAEGHVLEHRHVPEQRVVLEHEADSPLAGVLPGGVLGIEQHLAAVGVVEPGDDAQQRRLARAEGPSSATSSPSSTARFTSRSAVNCPKFRETSRTSILITAPPARLPARPRPRAVSAARVATRAGSSPPGSRWRGTPAATRP